MHSRRNSDIRGLCNLESLGKLRGKVAKRGLRDLKALDAVETVPVLTPRSFQSPLATWEGRRSFGSRLLLITRKASADKCSSSVSSSIKQSSTST